MSSQEIPKKRVLINMDEVLCHFGSRIYMRDIEGDLSVAINYFISDKPTYIFQKNTYQIEINKIYEDNRYIIYRVKNIYNTYLEKIEYSYE